MKISYQWPFWLHLKHLSSLWGPLNFFLDPGTKMNQLLWPVSHPHESLLKCSCTWLFDYDFFSIDEFASVHSADGFSGRLRVVVWEECEARFQSDVFDCAKSCKAVTQVTLTSSSREFCDVDGIQVGLSSWPLSWSSSWRSASTSSSRLRWTLARHSLVFIFLRSLDGFGWLWSLVWHILYINNY